MLKGLVMYSFVEPPADLLDLPPLSQAEASGYVLIRGVRVEAFWEVAKVIGVSARFVEVMPLRADTNQPLGWGWDTFKVYKSGKRLQDGRDVEAYVLPAEHLTLTAFLDAMQRYYWQQAIHVGIHQGLGTGSRYRGKDLDMDRLTNGIDALSDNELHAIKASIGDILTLLQRGYIRTFGKPFQAQGKFAELISQGESA